VRRRFLAVSDKQSLDRNENATLSPVQRLMNSVRCERCYATLSAKRVRVGYDRRWPIAGEQCDHVRSLVDRNGSDWAPLPALTRTTQWAHSSGDDIVLAIVGNAIPVRAQ